MPNLLELPTRSKKGAVRVVVETPRGSNIKLDYEAELGVFGISRALSLGVTYPHDWGFIPSTRAPDGDPLDAMVLFDGSTYPGVVLECRAIGVVKIAETKKKKKSNGAGGHRNDRIILVPEHFPRYEHFKDVADLSKPMRDEIEEFFATAVIFTEKQIKLLGWGNRAEAERIIDRLAI
jgi:inorganic pyrophosphatase